MALWILSGTTRVSRYQKKHSSTHIYRGHQSYLICFLIYYDPLYPLCSIYVLDSLFPQSFFTFSLVHLLAWHPKLHTPYISSPNHCLLFAAHAHTITTCFDVVPRLCHLIIVSLSTLYLELYLVAWCHTSNPSDHSHLCPLKYHLSHFPFSWARSHFHATYYFAHNCCTVYNLPCHYTCKCVELYTSILEICPSNAKQISTTCTQKFQ